LNFRRVLAKDSASFLIFGKNPMNWK